jgi:signal transduction histidine kinase/DNA-binding response OmpR family regulator
VDEAWSSCCAQTDPDSALSQYPNALDDERCTIRLHDDGDNHIQDTHLQATRGGVYRQNVDYICVSDIYAADFSDCYLDLLSSLQARAYLTIPIYVGDQLWGLLGSYHNQGPYEWDHDDIQMAIQVGSQLGVAIQQTELLNQTLQQAEELRQAKDSADAANRAKSDFLAHMSHELRTPLNAILGFAQLLERDVHLSPRNKHYTHIINSSGEHLLNLINNVLEMSKIEAGHLQRYDSDFELNAFLENIQAMLALKAQQKGLHFYLERFPGLPSWIRADENKLRQILFNLLGNAIKFTATGQVCLRVGLVARPRLPKQTADPAVCCLQFEVEDSGPGIAPSEADRLFAPFQQTQLGLQSAQGTGLGLPISHRYAQLMGGSLAVDSDRPQGSRFVLTLPVAVQSQFPSPPFDMSPAPSSNTALTQPWRILIAEDNVLNRLLLQEYLAPLECEIREVADGEAAIAVWQNWQPQLILMDIRMPKLDGQQATRQIRQAEAEAHLKPTVILAVTATAFEDKRQEMLSAGCDEVICKPFQFDDLMSAMQRHLQIAHPTLDCCATSQESAAPPLELTPEHLSAMPPDWLESLHRAACQCNDTQIIALLKALPSSQGDVIEAIAELAILFEFDRILDLTAPLISETTITTGNHL